jgi:hypothetical protein
VANRKELELEPQFEISAPGGNLISAPRLRLHNTVHNTGYVSDRTSGVAAEGWKEAPDAGKVPRLGQPDRLGAGAGYGEEEKDEE